MKNRRQGLNGVGVMLCCIAAMSMTLTGCDSGGGSSAGLGGGSTAKVGTSVWAGVIPTLPDCVVPVTFDLIAGQTIDIGAVTVANDEGHLYVQIDTDDPWVFGTVQVHIATADNPLPVNSQGVPIPGQFDWKHERDVEGGVDDPVSTDDFAIDLADYNNSGELDIAALDCDDTVEVWVHVEAFKLDGDEIIQSETAFGGDQDCEDFGLGGNRWCFFGNYTIQCCDDETPDPGEFRTQTMGGWGTFCHGENPGCYRDDNFDDAFPSGIVLGCAAGYTATFTSSEAVRDFLPSGGQPNSLTGDVTDPTSPTDAGVLLSQLLALELSLGFDEYDGDFSASPDDLGDQIVCNTGTACDGMTIDELADEANLVLGGCAGTTGLGAGDLAECIAIVNENFVDGEEDNLMVCSP